MGGLLGYSMWPIGVERKSTKSPNPPSREHEGKQPRNGKWEGHRDHRSFAEHPNTVNCRFPTVSLLDYLPKDSAFFMAATTTTQNMQRHQLLYDDGYVSKLAFIHLQNLVHTHTHTFIVARKLGHLSGPRRAV